MPSIESPDTEPKMDESSVLHISPIKFLLDLIQLGCVSLPILFLFLFGQPFQRGFFCNDETLLHPFHPSTVNSIWLYIIGLLMPSIVMMITEFKLSCGRTNEREANVFGFNLPMWLVNAYNTILPFLFGAAASQLTTDILKYTVGRLRPHFLTLCVPSINCTLPQNQHVFHTVYHCTNPDLGKVSSLKEMRLSFPSGHSSMSMFTMLYFSIYLQQKFRSRRGSLLKHTIQFLAISAALFTAASRICDNKHHPEDVIAGVLIGAIGAIIVANCVSNLVGKGRIGSKSSLHETPLNLYNGRSGFEHAA